MFKYCDKMYERSGQNLFWSIKKSNEVLNELKFRGFCASSLSTYGFPKLFTTLSHNLIKEKLNNFIEWTFHREGSHYLASKGRTFFTSEKHRNYTIRSCQKVCEALTFLLDNIYIRFGTKLFRQIVGIPMGTNCEPLVADLFLFCYESDFMMSLSEEKQSEVIEAFSLTSRDLDDLLYFDSKYFDGLISQIYSLELQLDKANSSETEAPFLDLPLTILDGLILCKKYDKHDDFDFDFVNFPYLDGDVPLRASYSVYISQQFGSPECLVMLPTSTIEIN